MAKHIGVVIFQNGDRRFFIYNAFNDTAWPELFTTRPLAEAAWEAHGDARYDPFAIDRTATTDSEPVALYSWDDMPDKGREPDFFTTASRLASAITGPIRLEDAMQDEPQPQKPADFRHSIDITGSALRAGAELQGAEVIWDSSPCATYIDPDRKRRIAGFTIVPAIISQRLSPTPVDRADAQLLGQADITITDKDS